MEIINQFTQFLLSQKKPASRFTIKNYKADLRHFIIWFEKEFSTSFSPLEVTPQIIEIYKNANTLSARSVERHISALRKFFTFLTNQHLVDINPFDSLNQESRIKNQEDPWKLKDFSNHLYVNNASSLTIKNYISDIEQFLSWIEKVLGNNFTNITKTVIVEYKKRLLKSGLTPRSINRKLSSLRKYLFWAEQEGFYAIKDRNISIDSFNSTENLNDSISKISDFLPEKSQENYSPFPPIRVIQKLSSAMLFLLDALIVEHLAKILRNTKKGLLDIKQKPLFSSKHNIGNLLAPRSASVVEKLEIGNYQKIMYAPLSISTTYFPLHKKIFHFIAHNRPKWYEKYHSYSITHYLHLAVLVLFTTICGFLITQRLSTDQNKQSVLGSTIDTNTKTLGFQGKLSDTSHLPITKKTLVKFVLYDDISTSSPLWEEGQDITPLNDGTFSTTLGKDIPIAKHIITDTPGLYLGISVNNQPELTPRQQIATTAYAQSSQTLQGMPASTQTNAPSKNVVLALDSGGNLTIGNNASPIFQATGGQFTLLGQSLLLTTSPGSNGNIQINPDGAGIVDIQKPIQNTSNNSSANGVPGAVEIADLFAIIATGSSQSAFTINQNDTGPIISASRSGTAKFTLENDGTTYIAGNVGVGKQNPMAKLQVAGAIAPSDTNTYDLGTPSYRFNTLYINSIVASSSGTLGYWQRTDTNVSPSNTNDALNVGASDTSSAIAHFAGKSNESSFIRSGNVGVGTASPIARLHVEGDQYISGNVGIGISSPNYKLDVLGSINASGDIYKNGTAFNNPDYVFEKWTTGNIVKFANNAGASKYKGMLSLEDTEAYVLQTLQLPNVALATGVFQRSDVLLEKVEEAYIHLFDLNRKISALIEKFTTKELITPIAQIDRVYTNVISPLAENADIALVFDDTSITVTNASGSAVAKIDNQGNANFAGNIESQTASISGILRAKKIIVDDIDTSSTASAKLLSSALLSPDELASYSGQLSLETLNASFGKFVQGLTSLGPTSLTDTTISGTLYIGKHLTIADESLNVIGADINIQPLRQGGISLLSGLIYIDTEGAISVVNNATFGKDVTVYGKLSAGIISPLPDQDLIIQNASGSAVLTINSIGDIIASGAATIKKLNLDIPEAIALSDTEVQSSGSAGIATISAQKTSLTVYNPHITEKSLIYITPRQQTENQVLYLLRQIPNISFTVGIQQAPITDVSFNWLIVN